MHLQNYSAVDAYHRWRDTSVAQHLQAIRRNYVRHRLAGLPTKMEYLCEPKVGTFSKWRTVILGRVTWAVFARAFWAIYQPGRSPAFYGSVVFSVETVDEVGPVLFEVAEYVRKIREYDVSLDGIEEFALVIRDDDSLPHAIEVPESVAHKRGIFLQTILMEREKLPDGYLHHRLIPITTAAGSGFVSAIHHRYWSDEFRVRWRQGERLLTSDQLRQYQTDFPDVVP